MLLLTTLMLLSLESVRPEFTCTGVGFYPHPSSCSQFYRCTDLWGVGQFQQHMFVCPTGTVWDQSISVCNWPMLVPGCGGEQANIPTTTATTTTTEATTTFTTKTTAASTTETTPQTTTTSTTEVTTESETTSPLTTPEAVSSTYRPSESSIYECEQPVIFDDEEHCNKFWLCKEETEGSGVLEVRKIQSRSKLATCRN